MNYILDLIKARPELAIIITGISSVLLFQLKAFPKHIYNLFIRYFTINLEVDSECEAYYLLDKWLNKQKFSESNRNMLLSNVTINVKNSDDVFAANEKTDSLSWRLTPGFGIYFFFYKRTFVFYRKTQKENNSSGQNTSKRIMLGNLTAFTKNKKIFLDIVDELIESTITPLGTPIYLFSGYWQNFDNRLVRPIESIFLKEGQLDRIIDNVQSFYDNKDWYISKGVPYRKGILLSGPPGTGKTSLILALAAHFKKKVYIVSISSMVSDKELFDAICNTSKDCFIVLEDIDCINATKDRNSVVTDDDNVKSMLGGVTMQGLLNILDGITTPEDRIFAMSTNHPEKLDSAFLRPGRVDIHEVLDKIDINVQKQMAKFFYSNDGFTGVNILVSPAELQKAFMIYKHDSSKAQTYIESIYNASTTCSDRPKH